jgi:plasmid maintenance system antidote protein VapI
MIMNTNKLLDPITPGEILRDDFMEPLTISINQLARDTALRLQRYFGVEAQFWLNLQNEYDLRMMKRKIWSDIERRIIPVKSSQTVSENSPPA